MSALQEYSGRTVMYQGHAYRVSPEVQLYLEKDQKIQAVKQLRQEYDLGLREAKGVADLIDSEFQLSTNAKSRFGETLFGETFKQKLEARLREVKESKNDVGSLLRDGVRELTTLLASIEVRLDKLESIKVELNMDGPIEECKRLIEMQSDRLTAQSHRLDEQAKEILELKRELEKRPKRRMILRKKEQE